MSLRISSTMLERNGFVFVVASLIIPLLLPTATRLSTAVMNMDVPTFLYRVPSAIPTQSQTPVVKSR